MAIEIWKADGEVKTISNELTLEFMQFVVGGYIEIANSRRTAEELVFNEEGKLKDLPINHRATDWYQKNVYNGDIIVGDCLFVSEPDRIP